MSIRTEIDIAATPDKVWGKFSDFEGLKQWQTWMDVHSPKNASTASPGAELDITLRPKDGSPFHMKPVVVTNAPAQEFRWRGKLWGSNLFFVGEHYFQLKKTPQGTTFVHGEEFKGCLVPLLGGVIKTAEVEFNKFNQGLKQQVEDSK